MAKRLVREVPREPRELVAFNIGIALNQLAWHRVQSLVTKLPVHIEAVEQSLKQISETSVNLFENEVSRELEHDVTGYLSDWIALRRDEDFQDRWLQCRRGLMDNDRHADESDLVQQFERLSADYEKKLEDKLRIQLQENSDLWDLVQLGKELDQVSHPSGLSDDNFTWISNPIVEDANLSMVHARLDSRRIISVKRDELIPPTFQFLNRDFQAATRIVKIRLRNSIPGVSLTEVEQSVDGSVGTLEHSVEVWAEDVRRQLRLNQDMRGHALTMGLDELAIDESTLTDFPTLVAVSDSIIDSKSNPEQMAPDKSNAPTDTSKTQVEGQNRPAIDPPEDTWITSDGWHFNSDLRHFAIGGQGYRLREQVFQLLKAVHDKTESCTSVYLMNKLWEPPQVDDAVKVTADDRIDKLRKLRDALNTAMTSHLVPKHRQKLNVFQTKGHGRDKIWSLKPALEVLNEIRSQNDPSVSEESTSKDQQ